MPLRPIETYEQRLAEQERQTRAKAMVPGGLSSMLPIAAWMGGLMLPSSGITDYSGLYLKPPTDEGFTGETMPSFAENIREKRYLDAFYQGLGLTGDLALAAGAVYPPSLALGAGMKVISGMGKAAKTQEQADMARRILPRYFVNEAGGVPNADVLRIKLPKSHNTTIEAKYVETRDGKIIMAPSITTPSGGTHLALDPKSFIYRDLDQAKTGLIDFALTDETLQLGKPARSKSREETVSKIRKNLESERHASVLPDETGIIDENFDFIPFTEKPLLDTEMSIKGDRAKMTREDIDRMWAENAKQDIGRIDELMDRAAARKRGITVSQAAEQRKAKNVAFEIPTKAEEEIITTDFGGGVTLRASRAETEKVLNREMSPENRRALDEATKRFEKKQEEALNARIREESILEEVALWKKSKAEPKIAAKADELLEWQKPLTEQQPAVQEKIKNLIGEDSFNKAVADGLTGKDVYGNFEEVMLNDDLAQYGLEFLKPKLSTEKLGAGAYLNEAGIRGIVYGPESVEVFDPLKYRKVEPGAKLPGSLQPGKIPIGLTNKKITARQLISGRIDPDFYAKEDLMGAVGSIRIKKKPHKYSTSTREVEKLAPWVYQKKGTVSKQGQPGLKDYDEIIELFSEADPTWAAQLDQANNSPTGNAEELINKWLRNDDLIPSQADEVAEYNWRVENQDEISETLKSKGYTPEGMTDDEVSSVWSEDVFVDVEDDGLPPFNRGGPVTRPLYSDKKYLI